MGRVLRVVLPSLLALVIVVPLVAFAYLVSLDTTPIDLGLKSVHAWFGSRRIETNTAALCLVCGIAAAVFTLIVILATTVAVRTTGRRRQSRRSDLMRSKLLERDEEIERLRQRLRDVGLSSDPAPAWAPPNDAGA